MYRRLVKPWYIVVVVLGTVARLINASEAVLLEGSVPLIANLSVGSAAPPIPTLPMASMVMRAVASVPNCIALVLWL